MHQIFYSFFYLGWLISSSFWYLSSSCCRITLFMSCRKEEFFTINSCLNFYCSFFFHVVDQLSLLASKFGHLIYSYLFSNTSCPLLVNLSDLDNQLLFEVVFLSFQKSLYPGQYFLSYLELKF